MRGLIHQHLKIVAPSLAVEFQDRYSCSLEDEPKHLIKELQKQVGVISSVRRNSKVEDESGGKQRQNDDRKKITFTTNEQLARGLVFHHLKTVAPSLAAEFRDRHSFPQETVWEVFYLAVLTSESESNWSFRSIFVTFNASI